MFSVILYIIIGCLSLIGSTIAMNDTLPEKVKSNVSSQVIRDCFELDKVEEETTEIVRLIESSMVNIVDIAVFTRNGSYNVLLVDYIGRKILPWLDENSYLRTFTFRRMKDFKPTLNAGRRNFEFYLNETRKGCIESELNGIDSLANRLLDEVAANMKGRSYENVEMCYLRPNIECRIDGRIMYEVGLPMLVIGGYYNRYLDGQHKKSGNSIQQGKKSLYYMLTKSRMSFWSCFLNLTYLEHGRVITFIRVLIYVCISVGMFTYLEAKFDMLMAFSGVICIFTKCTYLRDDYTARHSRFLKAIALIISSTFLNFSVAVFTCFATSIVTGMVYNILYYLPYLTFSSVFLFYSFHLWTSTMEVRQYTLQTLIHEALEKWNNDKTDNPHDSTIENKVVLVLHKNFYDKIERELLPFGLCLCWFFVKLAILFLVLFFVFHPVFFLFESDFNSDAKILTSMGVAALTFLLNMVTEKRNEKLVEAWEKEIKVNVTRMVNWYAKRGDQELTRTFYPVSSLVDHEIYLLPVTPVIEIRQHESSV